MTKVTCYHLRNGARIYSDRKPETKSARWKPAGVTSCFSATVDRNQVAPQLLAAHRAGEIIYKQNWRTQ